MTLTLSGDNAVESVGRNDYWATNHQSNKSLDSQQSGRVRALKGNKLLSAGSEQLNMCKTADAACSLFLPFTYGA